MAGRRKYPREFKVEAVRRVLEDGQSQKHVAQDLGINSNTLSLWTKQFRNNPSHSFPGNGRQTPEEAELTKLRRRVAELERENAFLKKAAAYFAKNDE
jgi:transposase